MFAKLSLSVLLLLSFWHGVHGARMLNARVIDELPPCKYVPCGIPNWDCFDPPLTPLPPCDFKHQNPGIDCSTDSQIPMPPPAPKAKAVTDTQRDRAQQWPEPLPPCEDVPGGIQNWDCYDPPLTPLPPCDFTHQNPGIDCSTDSQIPRPPASPEAKVVTDTQSARTQQWPEPLPPCNFPGAIPGWDCFDPPTHDLPPCDYKHQRPGIDCWPKSPPAVPVTKVRPVADISSTAGGASAHDVQSITSQSDAYHVEGMLPSCKGVPGGIQNWDAVILPAHLFCPATSSTRPPALTAPQILRILSLLLPPSRRRRRTSQPLGMPAWAPTAGIACPGQVHFREEEYQSLLMSLLVTQRAAPHSWTAIGIRSRITSS